MDTRAQHKYNAMLERKWIADAARDKHNLTREASTEWARGNRVEAQFLFEEAANASLWESKRRSILSREKKLSGLR